MKANEILINVTDSDPAIESALSDLERTAKAVLETYANVHRGSGHYSMITTAF